jgi:zinc and cadmium transporter
MLTGLLAVYCGIVVGASLVGGFIPSLVRLGHRRMQMLLSVVGGLMLGVGLLHQLPHSIVIAEDGGAGIDWCVGWMVGGLMLTFFLIRWFHAHSHDAEHSHGHDAGHSHGHVERGERGRGGHEHGPTCDHDHGHDHDHDHDHDHGPGHGHDHGHGTVVGMGSAELSEADTPVREGRGPSPAANSSWLGIFFGLSLHTLLDGFALGAHFAADSAHLHLDEHGFGGLGWWLPGLGTLLGVALHKPLDSLSITSLMAARGWSKRHQMLVNLGYSLMCPLGVFLFHVGAYRIAENHSLFIAAAVAMAAGVFVCISLSDLLPEIEFHSHDRLLLSGLLTLGLALAWGIGFLEPEHAHSHGPSQTHSEHGSGNHGPGEPGHGEPGHGEPGHGDHSHGDHGHEAHSDGVPKNATSGDLKGRSETAPQHDSQPPKADSSYVPRRLATPLAEWSWTFFGQNGLVARGL